MICRQRETENYGAVSFIIRIGREYAEKRNKRGFKTKGEADEWKKIPATAEESGHQF